MHGGARCFLSPTALRAVCVLDEPLDSQEKQCVLLTRYKESGSLGPGLDSAVPSRAPPKGLWVFLAGIKQPGDLVVP